MKTVYLTSGPRGSGKSTFTKQIIEAHPEASLISRDDILIELFGKTSLPAYTGGHHVALDTMYSRIKEQLMSGDDVTIILDAWNGFSEERKNLITKLKDAGADRVYCLYFIIPFETCFQWFMQKKDSGGHSEYSVKWDYLLFYDKSRTVDKDGFDSVIRIDPRQLLFPDFPFI